MREIKEKVFSQTENKQVTYLKIGSYIIRLSLNSTEQGKTTDEKLSSLLYFSYFSPEYEKTLGILRKI